MHISSSTDPHLSNAESAVMQFINQHIDQIEHMSISDIAEGAFVSNSTVSRTIRKCGFSSLAELKVISGKKEETNEQPVYLINQILSKSYLECLETIKMIQIDSIIEIVQMLHTASRVFLLANGLTALVADDFAFQLQFQQINTCVISDSQIMLRMDKLIRPGDVVIIISVRNTASELAIGAEQAKKSGAKVITCCCKKNTSLESYSDIVVYGYTQDISPNQAYGSASRLGLSIITRTIVEYMIIVK